MRMTDWNTYRVRGYTHDIAQDQASAGGVILSQVRRHDGGWQRRSVQSNGTHQAAGPVEAINDAEGEALFASAREY